MLLQFKIKNYFSFLEEACLNMEAAPINEHEYCLLDSGNDEKLLPVAAIYGANSAGKSNFIRAILFMASFIVDPRELIGEDESIPYLPFIYKKEFIDDQTEFEINYKIEDKEYIYCFICNRKKIYSEYLYFKEENKKNYKILYEKENGKKVRTGTSVFAKSYQKQIKYIDEAISKQTLQTLLLTDLGIRYGDSIFGKTLDWFKKIKFNSWGLEKKVNSCYISKVSPVLEYYQDEIKLSKLLNFIKKADHTITGFELKEVDDTDGKKAVYSKHKLIDSPEDSTVPLVVESDGTIKAISFFPKLDKVLSEGGILIADELDTRLHPLLQKEVINLFRNSETNPNKAQLIFTTHNALLMDKKYLRRDEIWFVDKDMEGRSELYSLVDIILKKDDNVTKVRNDADYCKQYILGNFGAVPKFLDQEV